MPADKDEMRMVFDDDLGVSFLLREEEAEQYYNENKSHHIRTMKIALKENGEFDLIKWYDE